MDLDRDMNPFGPSLNRRPFRGIFSVADHVFGKPKGLEDNPFAEESDCPPPGNDTISQPPTALEEVEQGLRYVGLHARRKFSDAKKKMRLRAGLQGFFEGESLGNEEKPPRRANPSPMDVDDCVKAENDWMDVLSDIECDTTYEPNKFRPRRPPGPIMQAVHSTVDSAAHVCESFSSASPSGIGSAIYGSLSGPLNSIYARSSTEDQLADEHAWMSTKLPPRLPRKKRSLESRLIEQLNVNSTFSLDLEAEYAEAKAEIQARKESVEVQKIKGLAKTASRRFQMTESRRTKKEGTRKDVTHPRDAPEGSNLDDLAVVAERVHELPRKAFYETCVEIPNKEKAIQSSRSSPLPDWKTAGGVGHKKRRAKIQPRPVIMSEASFMPTLGARCYSDPDPLAPQIFEDTFEPQKLWDSLNQKKEAEEEEGSACEKEKPAEPLSEKKKGKLPAESSQPFVDVDLDDDEDIEDEDHAEDWVCDEDLELL